jgi:hypothetical protein
MEHQKHRASLSNDDNEEGSKGEDEDMAALQSALNVLRRFGDGAEPSDADRPANVMTEESFARKQVASSPLRGPSPKLLAPPPMAARTPHTWLLSPLL